MNFSPTELTKLLRANPDLQVDGEVLQKQFPPTPSPPHTRNTPEHDLQVAIITECDQRAETEPEWGLLFAIPNGGKRHWAVAAKLKAEGARAGVPDLFWPIARHGFHGMFLELKISPNQPTAEQRAWITHLVRQGYWVKVIHDSFDGAMKSLEWYWRGEGQTERETKR